MAVPTTRLLDIAGDLLLDLTPANGYRRRELPEHGVVNDIETEGGKYLDGEAATGWHRVAITRTIIVTVRGVTRAQVEDRTQALIDAVSDAPFLYEVGVEGSPRLTTWRTVGPAASVEASFSREDLVVGRQVVTIVVRLQPNPTVTGV